MYTEFFGLQRLPFNLTPDPAFLFLPLKHREALAGLTYAILERKGFVVLIGDAGTGKTTLINSVLNRLPADRLECSIVLNPTLTGAEFLEVVMLDFDIHDVPESKAQRLWKLQEFVARVHRENRYAVLVIDEAHKLSLEVLEEIRLLGNFEGANGKFLQIVLVGQSELFELLNRYDLRQLKQRIALRLYIDRLNATEVQQYIAHRWAKGDAKTPPPFTPDAISGIVQWSQGIPRLINSICDTSLLMAFGDESPLVGLNYVRAAATNLALTHGPAPLMPASHNRGFEETALEPAEALAPPRSIVDFPRDASPMLHLAGYNDPKTNLSLLKRLAERFGI
ncbi:MAG TPA: AAA family ATPase [Bryobacteraceae bacterium]|nr:AAA family ATPase [Bryobacteraceae bacterium]